MTISEKKNKISELTEQRNSYMNQGKTLEEVEILRELAKLNEEVYGIESDENIKILNELGGTLKYIGAFDEAVSALSKAQKLISNHYGTENVAYEFGRSLQIYEKI